MSVRTQKIDLFRQAFKGNIIWYNIAINSFVLTSDMVSKRVFITWPKNFVFGQVLFSSACMCLCVCLSVCLCVNVYIDYLKTFSTDFNETWQDDV